MKVIGLTGGIATGKSTASRTLRQLGATIWDADETARQVVRPGEPGFDALKKEFGADIFGPDGRLNRRMLAQRVFGKPEEVIRLNKTLHPIILMDLVDKLKGWRAEGVKVVIVDAPLLFESGADVACDQVWVLSCGEDEQLRRVTFSLSYVYYKIKGSMDEKLSKEKLEFLEAQARYLEKEDYLNRLTSNKKQMLKDINDIGDIDLKYDDLLNNSAEYIINWAGTSSAQRRKR